MHAKRKVSAKETETHPAQGAHRELSGNSPEMRIQLLRQSREANLALPHSFQVPEPSDYRQDRVQIMHLYPPRCLKKTTPKPHNPSIAILPFFHVLQMTIKYFQTFHSIQINVWVFLIVYFSEKNNKEKVPLSGSELIFFRGKHWFWKWHTELQQQVSSIIIEMLIK